MSIGGAVRRTFYWAGDRASGGRVRAHYDELTETMGNYQRGLLTQKKKLDSLLAYAVAECPFFADCDPDCLASFPVTNKLVMIENRDGIVVNEDRIPGQVGAVHIQKTSGSTGTPFAIPQDTGKRARRIAELKWFNCESGFPSHERLGQCRIWTKWQSKSKWQSFRENIVPINVSKMDDETLAGICDAVQGGRLIALRAYASWYTALAHYIEKNPAAADKLKTLQVCFSSSEALDDWTREFLEATLDCRMVEAYANEENGLIAQQLGRAGYTLNHSGYYFELLKLDADEPALPGEVGRIVITDLHNYAYPFIRYDTGDTGVIECSEGAWPVLKRLYGRRIDMVYAPGGSPIHPMVFARILKNVDGIRQWQFVQTGEYSYKLKINRASDCFDEAACRAELFPLLGDQAVLEFEYVDEIPVLASGKRRPVVCEWRRE